MTTEFVVKLLTCGKLFCILRPNATAKGIQLGVGSPEQTTVTPFGRLEESFLGKADIDPAALEMLNMLTLAGAVGGKFAGVQYDLNQTWRPEASAEENGPERSLPLLIGASLCDHNCTTDVGNYDCPAAFTRNKGASRKWLTPADEVLASIATLAEGIDLARGNFFEPGSEFEAYCQNFSVAPHAARAMREALDKEGVEINLFGGNPEMHREITTIIRELKAAGHRVHFTTTGRRFMFDRKFVNEIVESPPDLVALSADDFDDAEHIKRLAGMSLADLAAERKTVPGDHGQRQKAYEAIYVAKLASEIEGFPPLLFNMVLHPGNLQNAPAIITALADNFPGVLVNPFPAQSAFLHEAPALSPEHAPALLGIIDQMLEAQISAVKAGRPTNPYAPRLHYWLMLRSVFDWAGDNHELAMKTIVGGGIWQCFRNPTAGRYLQAGSGGPNQVRESEGQNPGGCLGCFWNNETVTKKEPQIWDMAPGMVATYLLQEKSKLGQEAEHGCPGCAFPRLTDDMPATEAGMHPKILPHYLKRRQEVFGF